MKLVPISNYSNGEGVRTLKGGERVVQRDTDLYGTVEYVEYPPPGWSCGGLVGILWDDGVRTRRAMRGVMHPYVCVIEER